MTQLIKVLAHLNEAKTAAEEPEEKIFFGLGSWGNAYRSGDVEHFIIGPYETAKDARAGVKRKHEHGQPNGFRDWSSGTVKVVEGVDKLAAALKKMKLRMPKSIAEGDFDVGMTALWRPQSIDY